MTCAGKPDKATIENAANTLKIPEKQVSDCMVFGYGRFVILNLLTFLGGGRSVSFLFWPQLQVATRAILSVLSVAIRSCDQHLLLFVTQVTRQLPMFAAR